MERFEISTKSNGDFQFSLKTEDNETILSSEEGFSSLRDCNNAILKVRTVATRETAFEKERTHDGHYYFRIRNKSGDVLSVSRVFEAEKSCNTYMELVKSSITKASMTEY